MPTPELHVSGALYALRCIGGEYTDAQARILRDAVNACLRDRDGMAPMPQEEGDGNASAE